MSSSSNATYSSSGPHEDFDIYYEIDVASIVVMLFLAVVTVISNGAFLWTFYKDPLKCLRKPSAIFISGLTSANFVSGLIVEPSFVAFYFRHFLSHSAEFLQYFSVAQLFAFMTTTTSFLVTLALAIVQYLLIKFPNSYQKIVSPVSAFVGVLSIWIYSLIFGLIPLMSTVNRFAYVLTNLVLHIMIPTVLLVILYIAIYLEFRSRFQVNSDRRMEIQQASFQLTESEEQRRKAEKDFAVGTFILTFVLIILVWPFCVSLYMVNCCFTVRTALAVRIAQLFLLCKFAVDPFLFAWRFQKYRKSLFLAMRSICFCFKPTLPRAIIVRKNEKNSPKTDEDDDDDDDEEGLEVTVVRD